MIFNFFQIKTFVNNTTSDSLYVTGQSVIVNVNIAYLAETGNITVTTSEKTDSRDDSLSSERKDALRITVTTSCDCLFWALAAILTTHHR